MIYMAISILMSLWLLKCIRNRPFDIWGGGGGGQEFYFLTLNMLEKTNLTLNMKEKLIWLYMYGQVFLYLRYEAS